MRDFMRVLIIGASGFVGNALLHDFAEQHDVFGTYCHTKLPGLLYLDITDKACVEKVLSTVQPDIIIQPAAQPWVDFCEQQPPESYKINVQGAEYVIDWCENNKKRYVFLSTDYIFDGNNGPYTEDAVPNPLNIYGKHKLAVEEYIRQKLNVLGLIVRTTTVYGWERAGKNFVEKFIKTLQEGKYFTVPNDQYATPTYVGDLCRAIIALVEEQKSGIYHAAGPEYHSRVAFAEIVADVFFLPKTLIRGISTKDLQQAARRPLAGGLKTRKIERELDIHFQSPREALSFMKTKKNWL